MSNAFYAAFGRCRRKGFTKAYCYREVKKNLSAAKKRRKKKKAVSRKRLPSGMARRGYVCRRKTRVWSPALGKRVLRCTGGYGPKRRRKR